MKTLLLALTLTLMASPALGEDLTAPSFTLADADGNDVTLPRKHDGVDIYLFWASWCPYCKALMPHLQSMQIEYGDDIKVFALNIRDDEDPVEFMDENAYDFTLLPEADPIMELYGVKPTPAVFLVDGQGVIRLNLYEMLMNDSEEFNAMSHRQRAARRAPYWSASIRQKIDQILAE